MYEDHARSGDPGADAGDGPDVIPQLHGVEARLLAGGAKLA